MKKTKIDGFRNSIYVSIPGEGTIERGFRNKGDAIKHLEHNYGKNWRRLRPNFVPQPISD